MNEKLLEEIDDYIQKLMLDVDNEFVEFGNPFPDTEDCAKLKFYMRIRFIRLYFVALVSEFVNKEDIGDFIKVFIKNFFQDLRQINELKEKE